MSTADYIGMKKECDNCRKNHYYDTCQNCYIPECLQRFEEAAAKQREGVKNEDSDRHI